MPYVNKYHKYLNDEKKREGSFSALVQDTMKFVEKSLTAAALIGGGYYGITYLKRAGYLDNLTKYLNSKQFTRGIEKFTRKVDFLDAYLTGVKETIKSSGYKRVLSGSAHEELKANLKKNFLKAKLGEFRQIGMDPTAIERIIKDYSKATKDIAKRVVERVRLENIIADIKARFKDNPELANHLIEIVEKEFRKNPKLMDHLEANKEGYDFLTKVLKSHDLHIKLNNKKKDFITAHDELMRILRKHQMGNKKQIVEYLKKTNQVNPKKTNRDVIKEQIEKIKEQYRKSIIDSLKREGLIQKGIKKSAGHKNLTVQDALRLKIFDYPIEIHKRHLYKDGRIKTITYNLDKTLRRLTKEIPELKDAIVDPMVFMNKRGDLIDLRTPGKILEKTLLALSDNIQIPFVNIRPFKMISGLLGITRKQMPTYQAFLRGTVMPTIRGTLGALDQDYFYFNGKIVDQYGKLIRDKVYLVSAKYGPWQRAVRNQAGYSISNKVYKKPETIGEWVKHVLSIGHQDYESSLSRKFKAFTKFWDPEWQRNVYRDLKKGSSFAGNSEINIVNAFNSFFATVDNNARALDKDTLELILPHLKGVLEEQTIKNLIEKPRLEATMDAIAELLNKDKVFRKERGTSSLIYRRRLEKLLQDFIEDPESFEKPFKIFKYRHDAALPDIIESVTPTSTDVLTKLDEAQKLLHAELLNQIERQAATSGKILTIGDLANIISLADVSQEQVDMLKRLNVHKELQRIAGPDFFPGMEISEEAQKKFVGFIRSPSETKKDVSEELGKIIKKANPWYGYGKGQKYEPAFTGNDYLVIGEAINPFKLMMEDINLTLAKGGDIYDVIDSITKSFRKGVLNQLGFGSIDARAGRYNLDKVTTATNVAYYYLFRLNEGLSKIGLGLGVEDLGSTQDIAKNLFLKRILGPLVAINAVSYINDELGNATGTRPTEIYADLYKNVTIGVQAIKEITGINYVFRHLNRLMPGFERLGENPLGIAIKFSTFGIIGETRSPQEMIDYYDHGVDPVRRGRFWLIGSSTPIYGDRIKYYQPNWYRRIKADPLMTDVMYGSTSEYWAYHWMPNPRNPLGFLKPGRRQHWVLKHWEDRPYPVISSGLEDIPIVGPILDSTIGRILVPFRRRPGLAKAHREYLEEINKLYTYYSQQESGPGYLYITPGGRITPSTLTGEPIAGLAGGDYTIPAAEEGASPNIAAAPTEDGYVAVVDPRDGFGKIESGKAISRQEITNANLGIVSKAHISPIKARSIQSLRDNLFVEQLDEAIDPNSLAFRLGETYYSLTEIGGIYGFLMTNITGDLGDERPILQSASRMLSLKRWFWDQELGGIGGELSEIYRRFLPHRRRQIKEYNPFRNTMPSWLPGPEYFTDFRHGDPYVKIPKGELRLPGPGYEALNKLHPDFFGRYGALDRFKILADVAPYSDQYKYYSSVVSGMYKAGMISDEDYEQVKEIRKLVAKQKEKYDLFPYKFKYADIKKVKVTVLRWIDKDTFLTKEFPANPIRLAGIKMPSSSDKSAEAEAAREFLQKYVAPGKEITIGIDADPLNRVRDDTMNTMHAVIYMPSGDPLNMRLARGYKDVVKADWDDTSPTTVRALYDDFEISIGKKWEAFAHLDTPFHTKILQIRSPLEMYKRKELYGKSWQTWSRPIRDWLKPTFESFWSHNPLIASALGGFLGALTGVFVGSKKVTATIGALVGGLGASVRTIGEFTKRNICRDTDYTWIPKRRRLQREINEYFDILKYVKYKRLYEKARQLAIEKEGIDPEDIINRVKEKKESTAKIRKVLKRAKKWLKINLTEPFINEEEVKESIKSINSILNGTSANRELVRVGPLVIKALQYRQMYESTLYGADPYGDLMNIYRALPKKDRPFFKYFMLASPEEREEILRLVPKNQRRFYQAKWGLPVDKKPSLVEYFATHYLPDPEWEGWKPEYSIEEIKLKFLNQESLEVEEFGYWEEDVQYVKNAPTIKNIFAEGMFNTSNLEKVLSGKGLRDIDILVEVIQTDEEPSTPIEVFVDIAHDRRQDIINALNKNATDLLV